MGSCVKNALKLVSDWTWWPDEQTATLVHMARNESVYQCHYGCCVKQLTDEVQLMELMETLAADCCHMLIERQVSRISMPRRWALSVEQIVTLPIRIGGRGCTDTVCLVPTHIISDLSEFILSRLAAMHLSTASTHCFSLVTASEVADGLQWTYSCVSSAYICYSGCQWTVSKQWRQRTCTKCN